MTDAFLLGAGFSKAICPEMPTMGELYCYLGRLVDDTHGISQEVYEFANGNAETLLSYYAIPSPHDHHTDVLQKRLVAFQIENAIGDYLLELEEANASVIETNANGTNLVEAWHQRHSHVLTTNYDTLVERLAGNFAYSTTNGRPHTLKYEDIYPIPVSRATTREPLVRWGSEYPETFILYKMHGSTTWFRSAANEVLADPIYGFTHEEFGDTSNRKFIADKRRFIVPPVYDKSSLLNHESIRSLWRQAKDNALQESDNLYVIGYSLPETDVAMQTLLWEGSRNFNSAFNGRKSLYVINSDESIGTRYRESLGSYYEIKDCYTGGDDALERFMVDYVGSN